MKTLFYEDTELANGPSIFLAGPTVRNGVYEKSWRKHAVECLKRAGFDGTVYVPESKTKTEQMLDYGYYPNWELERLNSSDMIIFWIPRKLPKMPAFTTNVEFGRYVSISPNKVVLGYPVDSEKNRYLRLLYNRLTSSEVTTNLKDTVKAALDKMKRN